MALLAGFAAAVLAIPVAANAAKSKHSKPQSGSGVPACACTLPSGTLGKLYLLENGGHAIVDEVPNFQDEFRNDY